MDTSGSGLVVGADGWIAYRTKTPFDRLPEVPVLLARTTGGTPEGSTNGTALSPFRQSHCMINRLCQGCGEPAARGGSGLLHVLVATREDGQPAGWAGYTDMPPSCAACALSYCPVLAERGRQIVWAGEADVCGVYGYTLPPSGPRYLPDRLVLLDDERTLSATVATRFACDLQGVRKAELDEVRALALAEQNGVVGPGRAGVPASGPGRPVGSVNAPEQQAPLSLDKQDPAALPHRP
ncbi:hypothetical protein [Streptomyces sp. NPDC057682]|uniref:hypothetical protein n=1 Tax=Streptomyces sp. NPDC057682 TaxID=3346210 RepID=UPI0036AEA1FD